MGSLPVNIANLLLSTKWLAGSLVSLFLERLPFERRKILRLYLMVFSRDHAPAWSRKPDVLASGLSSYAGASMPLS